MHSSEASAIGLSHERKTAAVTAAVYILSVSSRNKLNKVVRHYNVGLARFVAGLVFPVGLMMVIILGTELFTGDCLMIVGAGD